MMQFIQPIWSAVDFMIVHPFAGLAVAAAALTLLARPGKASYRV